MQRLKCKDCKYFKRTNIPAARSGYCRGNEKYKDVWIGCGTRACEKFEKK